MCYARVMVAEQDAEAGESEEEEIAEFNRRRARYYAQRNRDQKAMRLVVWLQATGLDADQDELRRMDKEWWDGVCTRIGLHDPSEATIAQALGILMRPPMVKRQRRTTG